MILKRSHHRPKIGEIFIALNLITKEDLEKALEQQKIRLGEILVQADRITITQLSHALNIQKKKHQKIGEILKDLGYATEEDIRWALGVKNRKLGQILREMNLVTGYDITCALSFKNSFEVDPNGTIGDAE